MDSAADRITEFCARRGHTLGVRLAGGAVSEVYRAATADGALVVVKTDDVFPAALASEAEWLARHRHAPEVLELDCDLWVLCLEHVGGTLLVDDPPAPDLEREVWWLTEAHVATGRAGGERVDDLRDRYRRAFNGIRRREAARPWNVDGAAAWLEWAGTLDGSGWGEVALDAIWKNTIVDRAGDWWAIDPLCARSPDPVVWCPWTVDRSAKACSGDGAAAVIGAQEELLAASIDPDVSADWMPGALMWTLWWAHPGTPRHPLYLDLADHWLARWAARHT